MATLQGEEGAGMTRQDRACQPSEAGEVKMGANENGYPICGPLFHDSDRQGGEEEGEGRAKLAARRGYLRQGSEARAADWASAPPPVWSA